MTKKAKRNMYQVKKEYVGKVKLESTEKTIVLDDQTPQAVLEQLYDTVLGKGFIEQVPVKTTAAPQTA